MEETLKKILSEIELMRRLKMAELMEEGWSQAKIGSVIGVSQASVSRMLKLKKLSSSETESEDPNGS